MGGCKIILAGFVLSCFLAKTVSIVAVFTPPLGLFSILAHWQDQTRFSCELMSPYNGDSFYHGVSSRGEVTKTPWESIGGNTCHNGTDVVDISIGGQYQNVCWLDPLMLIPLSLPQTCIFVICIATTRLLLVLMAKYWLSEDFKREFTLCERILHDNIGATPLTTDWEEGKTLQEMRKKYYEQRLEMVVLLIIDFLENLILLVPVTMTFRKIHECHTLLQDSIGVSGAETASYENCLTLVVLAYIWMFLALFLELVLFYVYNHYMHLWRKILKEAINLKKQVANVEESKDNFLGHISNSEEQINAEEVGMETCPV